MAKIKDDGHRRVYVLPSDLLERLQAYQRQYRFTSEVEAVRSLLDHALKMEEGAKEIVARVVGRFSQNANLNEIAKDVLAGHPRVSEIKFSKQEIEFSIPEEGSFKIKSDGSVEALDFNGINWVKYPDESRSTTAPHYEVSEIEEEKVRKLADLLGFDLKKRS